MRELIPIRIVLGIYDTHSFTVEIIDQISNDPVDHDGYLHWDIQRIFEGLKQGLQKAYRRYGKIDTVGVTTWGIDFGMLDEQGELIADPLCYRNTLGSSVLTALSPQQLLLNWEHNGIQNHPMNSLYQLLGIREKLPERFEKTHDVLFIPDLLIYLFTGEKKTERSIVSTSQMYTAIEDGYSDKIFEEYDIPQSWMPPIEKHGKCIGWLKSELAEELNIAPCPFICTPSHDTASAVTAMPTDKHDQLFISSGTWSLIGAELTYPIISPSVENYRFANEAGVLGTTTLLKNSTGLYLLQEMKKYCEEEGHHMSWDEISQIAESSGMNVPVFDPNHSEIFSTRNMYQTLSRLTKTPDWKVLLASCYLSLTLCYQKAINELQQVTVKKFDEIFIIGGGTRDEYLNQLTADITGLPVHVGPIEAASIGNLASQLLYMYPEMNLDSIRQAVINSTNDERRSYAPQEKDNELIRLKIDEYKHIIQHQ